MALENEWGRTDGSGGAGSREREQKKRGGEEQSRSLVCWRVLDLAWAPPWFWTVGDRFRTSADDESASISFE